jgi:hypothetical protein
VEYCCASTRLSKGRAGPNIILVRVRTRTVIGDFRFCRLRRCFVARHADVVDREDSAEPSVSMAVATAHLGISMRPSRAPHANATCTYESICRPRAFVSEASLTSNEASDFESKMIKSTLALFYPWVAVDEAVCCSYRAGNRIARAVWNFARDRLVCSVPPSLRRR